MLKFTLFILLTVEVYECIDLKIIKRWSKCLNLKVKFVKTMNNEYLNNIFLSLKKENHFVLKETSKERWGVILDELTPNI